MNNSSNISSNINSCYFSNPFSISQNNGKLGNTGSTSGSNKTLTKQQKDVHSVMIGCGDTNFEEGIDGVYRPIQQKGSLNFQG